MPWLVLALKQTYIDQLVQGNGWFVYDGEASLSCLISRVKSYRALFVAQISSLRKELDEAKQTMVELENKLKFKEETAAAAMAARDAAEKSLKLADMRSSRLRERLEELNRQLEESDNRTDSVNRNGHRYMCWPWQWLGLNYVRLPPVETDQTSNEMELSEPLII